jgi:hypothetical protein
MSTKNNVHCPKCGLQSAQPVNRDRAALEHSAQHWGAHNLPHNPALAAIVLAGARISKWLPKAYRCDCGHTFSA